MSYRDPTADELVCQFDLNFTFTLHFKVQRFRLTSTSSLNSTAPKRPSLTVSFEKHENIN